MGEHTLIHKWILHLFTQRLISQPTSLLPLLIMVMAGCTKNEQAKNRLEATVTVIWRYLINEIELKNKTKQKNLYNTYRLTTPAIISGRVFWWMLPNAPPN